MEIRHAIAQMETDMRGAQAGESQLEARLAELTAARNDESRVVPELNRLESEQESSVGLSRLS